MHNYLKQIREKINPPFFTDTELMQLIKGSPNARYAWVKRAISCGDIISVRRGLYCIAESSKQNPINIFELALRIYGPSYISLESALSFHGLIPERVSTTTSVCLKRATTFKNNFGVFSYQHISKKVFYAGVEFKKENNDIYYMAAPWTAIMDYVQVNKKKWKGLKPLSESLRIEIDETLIHDFDKSFYSLSNNYPNRRAQYFLKSVRKELKK